VYDSKGNNQMGILIAEIVTGSMQRLRSRKRVRISEDDLHQDRGQQQHTQQQQQQQQQQGQGDDAVQAAPVTILRRRNARRWQRSEIPLRWGLQPANTRDSHLSRGDEEVTSDTNALSNVRNDNEVQFRESIADLERRAADARRRLNGGVDLTFDFNNVVPSNSSVSNAGDGNNSNYNSQRLNYDSRRRDRLRRARQEQASWASVHDSRSQRNDVTDDDTTIEDDAGPPTRRRRIEDPSGGRMSENERVALFTDNSESDNDPVVVNYVDFMLQSEATEPDTRSRNRDGTGTGTGTGRTEIRNENEEQSESRRSHQHQDSPVPLLSSTFRARDRSHQEGDSPIPASPLQEEDSFGIRSRNRHSFVIQESHGNNSFEIWTVHNSNNDNIDNSTA
jgi:hypothetical protein